MMNQNCLGIVVRHDFIESRVKEKCNANVVVGIIIIGRLRSSSSCGGTIVSIAARPAGCLCVIHFRTLKSSAPILLP
jgi:hypothetical protein